jgi:hypothetical protein
MGSAIRKPLNKRECTQMANDPRVSMVAAEIIPDTPIAPMLSLIIFDYKSRIRIK